MRITHDGTSGLPRFEFEDEERDIFIRALFGERYVVVETMDRMNAIIPEENLRALKKGLLDGTIPLDSPPSGVHGSGGVL